MLFIKISTIFIIVFIMDVLKYLYVPMIVKYRHIARAYVYNYFIQTNRMRHYIPNVTELKGYYYHNGEIYLAKIDIRLHKMTILCYYLLVWIWLDDTNRTDVVDVFNLTNNLLTSSNTPTRVLELRKECGAYIDLPVFIKPLRVKYDVSLNTLLLDLYYSKNNNLANQMRYSRDSDMCLGVGYKEYTYIKDAGNLYYMELWGIAL